MNLRLLIFLSFYRVCHAQNYLKLTRLLLQHQEDFISSVGNDTECAKQLRLFTKDLNEFRTWTIMMLDSTAKLESGLLQGRVIMMGSYDECLEISDYSNGSYIEGQFCTTTVTPTESTLQCINNQMAEYFQDAKMNNLTHLIDMKWGVCSMAACSPDQLQQLWDFIENRYQIRFHMKFVDSTCYKRSKTRDLTLVDTIAIYIFGVLVLLLLSSTLYDILFFQQKHEKKWNLWVTFSLYNNAKRLLSTKKEDETNITCLYGIRVIFMAWIVLGHSYFIYLYMMSVNNIQLITLLQQDSSMFILGAYASVDTYLLISGCLIVYITSLAKERGTPISLLVFYVHRVLRLSPAYAAVMLISAGPIVYFGSGPFWNNVNQAFKKRCIGGWWQNLLYIQNYYGADAGCLIQGWYLAVDTQLYFISPVIFLLLQKWSKGGIIVTVFLIICSVVVNIVATYYYNIDSLTPQTMEDYFLQLYSRTHFRAAPWLVGTLLGHALLIYRKKRVIMNKLCVIILWAVSVAGMLYICHYYVIIAKNNFTVTSAAMFNGFSRVAWAICNSWIIFACANGYGGCVQKFLSLPFFRVLSRLTYGIYLTHIMIIWCLQFQSRTLGYVDNIYQFHRFWGNYIFSVVLSTFWVLIFESPVALLESWARKKLDNTKATR